MFYGLDLFSPDRVSYRYLEALNAVIYMISLSLMEVIKFLRLAEGVCIERL